jgi:hypothetical protein
MKRLVPAALVAALAVTGVAAGVHVAGADSQPGSAPVAVAPAPEPAVATPPAPQPKQVQPAAPKVDPRAPKKMRLWKFDAPVVPIDLEGETLVPPSDPQVLGWWGQPAGSSEGTTLLFGHTVSTGGGELDDLEDTPVGKVAKVSGVKYRVERVQVISKTRLAKRAETLFDQDGPAKLVIVTCEGYDAATGTYADNVVVVAKPV